MIFGVGVKGCGSDSSASDSSSSTPINLFSTSTSYPSYSINYSSSSSKKSSSNSSAKSSSSYQTASTSNSLDYSYHYEGDFKFTVWTLNGSFYYCTVGAKNTTLAGEVDVPSTYGSYPVTYIDYGAFENCTQLTRLNIPSSITYISGYAFDKCTKLSSFVVDEDNSAYYSYGGVLYGSRDKSIVKFPAGKIGSEYTIKSGTEQIESEAFGDTNLVAVNIPTSVTYIGGWVFENALSLTTIKYSGTKTQWNSIEKFERWNANSSLTKVECSNGTIYL